MKELSIEEKAKRYDEAIKIIKDSRTHPNYPEFIRVNELFPELKESKEEKIKKEIIKIVQYYGTSLNFKHTVSEEDMVAWLKKQDEQPKDKSALETIKEEKVDNQNCVKPTDKVEPDHLLSQKCMYYTCIKDYYSSDNTHLYVKGHIYKYFFDGYINNESNFNLSLVNSFAKKYFELTKDEDWIVCEHDNNISKPMQYKKFKKEVNQKIIKNLEDIGFTPKFRLWTIEDAKDGDVLVSQYHKPFIYNGNYTSFCLGAYCGITADNKFKVTGEKCFWTNNKSIHPATKEQQDYLFQKIKEAGYEFDFDKKELKKIN